MSICGPTSAPPGPPENIPNSSTKLCSSAAKCGCSGVYKANNPFVGADKCKWIEQLKFDGGSYGLGSGSYKWNADVFLDMGARQITVTHRIRFINLSKDPQFGYGGSFSISSPLEHDEFSERVNKIPGGIRRWWNAKPYRLKIRDRVPCGDVEYKIVFNPIISSDSPHYTIYLYNIPYEYPEKNKYIFFKDGDKKFRFNPVTPIPHPRRKGATLGRSFVDPENFTGYWNLGDPRTCTDEASELHNDMLEVHEYAHMIGLPDVYQRHEDNKNGARFHTRGNIGIGDGDDVRMVPDAKGQSTRMLGGMSDVSD